MKQQTISDVEYSARKRKTKREEFLEIMDELAQQTGETVLPQRFIGENGDRVCQIQASCVFIHGNADTLFPEPFPEIRRQSGSLLAEEQPAVRREPGCGVVLRCLGSGQPKILRRFGMGSEE